MFEGERIHPMAEQLKLLSQTGPGTDMGKLMRRFWQPVAVANELAPGAAKLIRILSEDLTIYRGESGQPYLVAGRCAHRSTLLHTGWIQQERIRCMYHGWQYDGSGQCTERPAEGDKGLPNVRITSYPVHEYAGLLFAFMGEGTPPEFELPRKDVFERADYLIFAKSQIWPCNWFQQIENSMDAVHVSFVHQWGRVGNFGQTVSASIPELEYAETDAGIRQVATRGEGNVRVSDWTFPNNNHIAVPNLHKDDPWIENGVWMVPVDDGHTLRFQIRALASRGAEADAKFVDYFNRHKDYNPVDHHHELFDEKKMPDDPVLELTPAQDYVAQVGQGAIVDRTQERLGKSDRGIAFMRRMFWREMEAARAGQPLKQWRKLAESEELLK
jgi:5,5'-dehydrodivanillate O-demethylase